MAISGQARPRQAVRSLVSAAALFVFEVKAVATKKEPSGRAAIGMAVVAASHHSAQTAAQTAAQAAIEKTVGVVRPSVVPVAIGVVALCLRPVGAPVAIGMAVLGLLDVAVATGMAGPRSEPLGAPVAIGMASIEQWVALP
mmetsp:Transcript_37588/g.87822  ORF Transcript_37588/g.87822 Transcript_37588/m.87822 type:complete len:141 (+) Transcript_37588:330-752(+)